MNFFDVAILSLVEGTTEFLPISSTGHLILTSHILGISSSNFTKTFEVAIQLGAIASVVTLYWREIMKSPSLFLKAIVGFVPTGIIGFTVYPYVKNLLDNDLVTVSALLIGGVAIIGLEKLFEAEKHKIELKQISYKQALGVGLIQSIALIPGVSRAAASIFGGMGLKLNRKSAVEFSFLLAIPTMSAATGYDLLKSAKNFNAGDFMYLGVGMILSFIVGLVVLRWFIKYIKSNNFFIFGIYRIAFSLLYFLLFIR